jgi:hypothetical protein
MLKIRLQGIVDDIKWFRKQLNKNREIRVSEFSQPFAHKGTNKYFRVYAEIAEAKKK